MTIWTKYEVGGSDYIPMSEWGKDHWSTLAYLETCAVDNLGIIDNRRMRTNPRLHRKLVGISPMGEIQDGSKYPTIAKSGNIPKHDDWSCLEDAVAASLVEVEFTERYHRPFGGLVARVKFNENGLKVVAQLREYRSNGGNFGSFAPTVLDQNRMVGAK